MELSHHCSNATQAIRLRNRIERDGVTPFGDKVWTPDEDKVMCSFFPDYGALLRALPHRTRASCLHRARKLQITKQRACVTNREVSILRRLYPTGSRDEILALLPNRTWKQIEGFASHRGIRRKQRPYAPTGVPIIDQIRSRCRELNYTMIDLDKMIRSKGYFSQGKWAGGHIHHRDIGRAVAVLFGDIRADWK